MLEDFRANVLKTPRGHFAKIKYAPEESPKSSSLLAGARVNKEFKKWLRLRIRCKTINNWFMLSVRTTKLWMHAGSLKSTREDW